MMPSRRVVTSSQERNYLRQIKKSLNLVVCLLLWHHLKCLPRTNQSLFSSFKVQASYPSVHEFFFYNEDNMPTTPNLCLVFIFALPTTDRQSSSQRMADSFLYLEGPVFNSVHGDLLSSLIYKLLLPTTAQYVYTLLHVSADYLSHHQAVIVHRHKQHISCL
jgi:hypothetical protein